MLDESCPLDAADRTSVEKFSEPVFAISRKSAQRHGRVADSVHDEAFLAAAMAAGRS